MRALISPLAPTRVTVPGFCLITPLLISKFNLLSSSTNVFSISCILSIDASTVASFWRVSPILLPVWLSNVSISSTASCVRRLAKPNGVGNVSSKFLACATSKYWRNLSCFPEIRFLTSGEISTNFSFTDKRGASASARTLISAGASSTFFTKSSTDETSTSFLRRPRPSFLIFWTNSLPFTKPCSKASALILACLDTVSTLFSRAFWAGFSPISERTTSDTSCISLANSGCFSSSWRNFSKAGSTAEDRPLFITSRASLTLGCDAICCTFSTSEIPPVIASKGAPKAVSRTFATVRRPARPASFALPNIVGDTCILCACSLISPTVSSAPRWNSSPTACVAPRTNCSTNAGGFLRSMTPASVSWVFRDFLNLPRAVKTCSRVLPFSFPNSTILRSSCDNAIV